MQVALTLGAAGLGAGMFGAVFVPVESAVRNNNEWISCAITPTNTCDDVPTSAHLFANGAAPPQPESTTRGRTPEQERALQHALAQHHKQHLMSQRLPDEDLRALVNAEIGSMVKVDATSGRSGDSWIEALAKDDRRTFLWAFSDREDRHAKRVASNAADAFQALVGEDGDNERDPMALEARARISSDFRDGFSGYGNAALHYARPILIANLEALQRYRSSPEAYDALVRRLESDASVLRSVESRVQYAYHALSLSPESMQLYDLEIAEQLGAISAGERAAVEEVIDKLVRGVGRLGKGIPEPNARVQVLRDLYGIRAHDFAARNTDNPEVALYESIDRRSPLLWSKASTWDPTETSADGYLYNRLENGDDEQLISEALVDTHQNIVEFIEDIDRWRAEGFEWEPGDDIPEILIYDGIRAGLIANSSGADHIRFQVLDNVVSAELEHANDSAGLIRSVVQWGGTLVGAGSLLLGQPEIAIPAFGVAAGTSVAHSGELYLRADLLERRQATRVEGDEVVTREQALAALSELDAEVYWALLDAVDVAGAGVASVQVARRIGSKLAKQAWTQGGSVDAQLAELVDTEARLSQLSGVPQRALGNDIVDRAEQVLSQHGYQVERITPRAVLPARLGQPPVLRLRDAPGELGELLRALPDDAPPILLDPYVIGQRAYRLGQYSSGDVRVGLNALQEARHGDLTTFYHELDHNLLEQAQDAADPRFAGYYGGHRVGRPRDSVDSSTALGATDYRGGFYADELFAVRNSAVRTVGALQDTVRRLEAGEAPPAWAPSVTRTDRLLQIGQRFADTQEGAVFRHLNALDRGRVVPTHGTRARLGRKYVIRDPTGRTVGHIQYAQRPPARAGDPMMWAEISTRQPVRRLDVQGQWEERWVTTEVPLLDTPPAGFRPDPGHTHLRESLETMHERAAAVGRDMSALRHQAIQFAVRDPRATDEDVNDLIRHMLRQAPGRWRIRGRTPGSNP